MAGLISAMGNGNTWFCGADDLDNIVACDERVLAQIHGFVKVGAHTGFDIGGVCTVLHLIKGVGEASLMEFGLIHAAHAGEIVKLDSFIQDVDGLHIAKIECNMIECTLQMDHQAMLLALE